VRREVLVRDAHRCRMPGCGRSRFLEVHHVRPRAAGGSNRAENLVTLCSGCHGVLHELGETRSRALLNSG
jgi:5-methylcytosine-specific restriction endonuclease McrA